MVDLPPELARIIEPRAGRAGVAHMAPRLADSDLVDKFGGSRFADAFARIEAHYFVNGGFFRRDSQLLRDAHELRHLPGVIVQGRYDMACPMRSAWDLHRAWPQAKFVVVPDAEHAVSESGILAALIAETDALA